MSLKYNPWTKKVHKYNAKVIYVGNKRFDSKKEAKRYEELLQLKKDGKINLFLMQTPFHLKSGIKYILDFIIFWTNGTITFEDVKGFKTPIYKLKKKLVENEFPIIIEEYK